MLRDYDWFQIKCSHKCCQLEKGLFVFKENYVTEKIHLSLSPGFFPQLQVFNNEAYNERSGPK